MGGGGAGVYPGASSSLQGDVKPENFLIDSERLTDPRKTKQS